MSSSIPGRKTLGEKIAMLLKSSGKSQTQLASSLEMPLSQINRFLRGRSDLSSSNLVLVLKELGIDLNELLAKKIREHNEMRDLDVKDAAGCVQYLFESLDELGQQTY